MFSVLNAGNGISGYQRSQMVLADGCYMEFVADTVDDVATLPTGNDNVSGVRPRPGSMAVCIGNRSLYILSNARKWVLFAEVQ